MSIQLIVAGLAVAGAAAFMGYQALEISGLETKLADEKRDRAEEKFKLEKAANDANVALLKKEREWNAKQAESDEHAAELLKKIDQRVVVVDDRNTKLWMRYAAAERARCNRAGQDSSAAAAGAASAAEGSPGDLSTDVPRRVGEALGQVARVADTARVRGLKCEKDSDTVRE